METTRTIVRVNNVDIVATSDEQRMVPIKPICEALGIDRKRQQDRTSYIVFSWGPEAPDCIGWENV